MICYFTGTGNSAYVASRIAGQTEQEVLNLFEKIRSQDHTALHSEKPWVIVCSTYAWRIPRILSDWLKQTPPGFVFCHDLRRQHRKRRSLFEKALPAETDEFLRLFSDCDAGKLSCFIYHSNPG